ncbi:MAG TPA: ABC transporter substrate-binding protein [Noviherbaspirillum sp.]|nr:ABC transporter substrate-binding protein [Noviherbaspirillum sp.]
MHRPALPIILIFFLFAKAPFSLAQGRIVVGQSVELSGQATGKENMQGALAYFAWLNSQGGIHGRHVELRTYDDRRDPVQTLANTERLLNEDGAVALFGYRSTPTVEKVLPLLQKEKVALVAPFSGAQSLHQPFNPYVFHLRASYQDEAEKMAESLATLQITKVAILYQDDAFGRDGLEGFRRSLDARRLAPLATATYDRKKLDVAPAVAAITAVRPQAVMMACTPSACADFIKQMRQRGEQPQFLMLSNVNSEEFFRSLGETGRGIGVMQVMPYPKDVGAAAVREFQRVLKEMRNPPPASYAALEGFIAAKLLGEGLRRAGPAPTREKLLRALEQMQDVDLGGVRVGYAPMDRRGSRFVELTIIGKNGVIWR